MPTQRRKPRARETRYALSCLQRYRVMREGTTLCAALVVVLAMAVSPGVGVARRRQSMAAAMLLAVALSGAQVLLSMPRDSTVTAVQPRYPIDFGDSEFYDHFRFGRRDFFRLLKGLDLANVVDVHAPRYIRIGRRLVRTDWALLVLLKRSGSVAAYKDVRWLIGGSKTGLCTTFLYMLEYVYNGFCDRCTSLLPWQHYLQTFEKVLKDKGSPFDGLVVSTWKLSPRSPRLVPRHVWLCARTSELVCG
jgi:hypothetical protein